MIEKEELVTALSGMLDGDLSEGTIEYVADNLLEMFVMFERPEVEVRRDGKFIRLGGARLDDRTLQFWQAHMAHADIEMQRAIRDYVSGHAVMTLYEEEQDHAKAVRRGKLALELGGVPFEELPGMVRTLIWRLVDAEAANEYK